MSGPELFDRHRVEVVQHVLQGVATLRFSIAGYVTSDDCHRLVTGMRDLCG